MKKSASLALFFVVLSSASAQTFFQGSFDEALAKAKTEGKKVLVDFYSPG